MTTTEEIFSQANVTPEEAPEMFAEVETILQQSMAQLSATMGLSYGRVEAFDKQKAALVGDLIALKHEGHLR